MFRFALIAVTCGLLAGAPPSPRTAWFRDGGWGVFIHYLAPSPDLSAAEWNRLVSGFDVDALARQLQSAGAAYLFLTIGQNSGHYLAPNPVYDRYVGIRPSKCSQRDLVRDLSAALKRRGIRLMVYLPAGAPDRDPIAISRLGWRSGPYRNREFQIKWQKIIQAWSARWTDQVAGWWFDGCYWPNAMYRSPRPPNFATFAASARKGNPQAIVAFNRGVIYPIISITPYEDYTAGETNDPSRVSYGEFWQDGAQFHMLSYLGRAWSAGPPRFSTSQVVEWTTRIVSKGGVVSWDVPTTREGRIPDVFLQQLGAIGEAIKAGRVNRPSTNRTP